MSIVNFGIGSKFSELLRSSENLLSGEKRLFRHAERPLWGRSEKCLCLGLGGVDLRGAGDGMFLVSNHGLDQLHRAAKTQGAAVQAEVIRIHRAPLLRGVVFAVGCPALVGFLDQAPGLLRRHPVSYTHLTLPTILLV